METQHQTAGVENAGVKSMESEDFKNVFLTVLTERLVWKQTRTLLLHKGGLSRDDFLGFVHIFW